jgi:hypothetical protein
MKRIFSKSSLFLVALFIFSLGIISSTIGSLSNIVNAQSNNCNDSAAIVLSDEILHNGNHSLWVLAKQADAGAKIFIKAEGGACQEMGAPKGAGWEWVSGPDGQVRQTLETGTRTFSLYAVGGAILIDKLLVTNDLSCTPTELGQNCLQEELDFELAGISSGQASGDHTIQANVFRKPVDAQVSVEFFLDGNSHNIQQTEPYCFTGEGDACEPLLINSLGNGDHTIRAVAKSQDKTTEHTVNFTVVNPSESAPAPEQDAVQNNDLPKLDLEVSGIKAGDVVNGGIVVGTVIKNTVSTANIRYKLNHDILVDRTASPFCIEKSGLKCSEWDTTSYINGKYTLYIVANAPGFQETWVTLPIEINNTELAFAVGSVDNTLVVGNANQQVFGDADVTIPDKKSKNNGKIVYKIDNKIVAQASTAKPKVRIQTSKVGNGKKVLAATITFPNGDVQTLQSEIDVKNDIVSATNNWFRENIIRSIVIIALICGAVFLLVHFIVGEFRKRQLIKQHNITDTYTYVELAEQKVLKTNFVNSFAAVAILLVVFTILARAGSIQAATGLGFVHEVESAVAYPAGTTQGDEGHMSIIYMRLAPIQAVDAAPAPATTVPATTPVSGCPNITEWSAQYFTNAELQGAPALCRNESRIDYDYEYNIPAPGIPGDNFSVRWTRTLAFSGGQYNFAVWADDGTRLFIDGVLEINSWGPHWGETYNITRNLAAGNHTLVLEFQEIGGDASVSLNWAIGTTMPAQVPSVTASIQPVTNTPTPAPIVIPPTTTVVAPTPSTSGQNWQIPTPGIGTNRSGTFNSGNSLDPSSDGFGAVRFNCNFSHMNYDDAIVYPGQPGRAHMHTYFGNLASNAFLDINNIRNVGNSTCDGGTSNRSSYWVPTLIDANNRPVVPSKNGIYYKTGYGARNQDISANLPVGLRMIAGDASASSPQPVEVGFKCENNGVGVDYNTYKSVPNCPAGQILKGIVKFPQCWDGKNLDSPNHKSHMAYVGSGGCPSSHPVTLPEITYNIDYHLESNSGPSWSLSSDMYTGGPGGYSMHGDLIVGWDPAISTQWLQNCDIAGNDCHVNTIASGISLIESVH